VAGTGPQERPAAYKEWPSRNLSGPRSVPLPRACVVSLGVHAACQGEVGVRWGVSHRALFRSWPSGPPQL
jgi:hypothetical protein